VISSECEVVQLLDITQLCCLQGWESEILLETNIVDTGLQFSFKAREDFSILKYAYINFVLFVA